MTHQVVRGWIYNFAPQPQFGVILAGNPLKEFEVTTAAEVADLECLPSRVRAWAQKGLDEGQIDQVTYHRHMDGLTALGFRLLVASPTTAAEAYVHVVNDLSRAAGLPTLGNGPHLEIELVHHIAAAYNLLQFEAA